LFTGGRIRGDEMVAAAALEESRARLSMTRELAALDSRSAVERLEAAEASWRASSGTVEQAERAYGIAEIRYQEGVSTQLELADSRILLEQAGANRAVAARDVQVARLRVALLPYLSLGAGAGEAAAPQQQPMQQQPERRVTPVMPAGGSVLTSQPGRTGGQ
jgi:outer membrane protein TolC